MRCNTCDLSGYDLQTCSKCYQLLCTVCWYYHKVECEVCHGNGSYTYYGDDGEELIDCDRCDGTGRVACA